MYDEYAGYSYNYDGPLLYLLLRLLNKKIVLFFEISGSVVWSIKKISLYCVIPLICLVFARLY